MLPKAVVKSDLSEHQRISTVTTGGDDSREEGFNRKQNWAGRAAETQLFSLGSSESERTLAAEQEELPEDEDKVVRERERVHKSDCSVSTAASQISLINIRLQWM